MTDSKNVPIEFQPASDYLLIRVDWVERSALELDQDPTLLPSGVVLAVGPGRILASGERLPISYSVGDHVMVRADSLCLLPIREDPREVVALVQEDHVLGAMQNAQPGSCWFKARGSKYS